MLRNTKSSKTLTKAYKMAHFEDSYVSFTITMDTLKKGTITSRYDHGSIDFINTDQISKLLKKMLDEISFPTGPILGNVFLERFENDVRETAINDKQWSKVDEKYKNLEGTIATFVFSVQSRNRGKTISGMLLVKKSFPDDLEIPLIDVTELDEVSFYVRKFTEWKLREKVKRVQLNKPEKDSENPYTTKKYMTAD